MNIKLASRISFGLVCAGLFMWFIGFFQGPLFYYLGDYYWNIHWSIQMILMSVGLIIFSVGLLTIYKSVQVPAILLIVSETFEVFINLFDFGPGGLLFQIIFTIIYFGPLILLLIFLLQLDEIKALKKKIIIAMISSIMLLLLYLVHRYIFALMMGGEYELHTLSKFQFITNVGSFIFSCVTYLLLTGSFMNVDSSISSNSVKDKDAPMTIGDWLLTYLLLIIPIVNIVMLFVWGFGSNTNLSKASWAKASLIWFCIIMVIYVLFFITTLSLLF